MGQVSEFHDPNGSPRSLLAHKEVYRDPDSHVQWYLKQTGIMHVYGFKTADTAGYIQYVDCSRRVVQYLYNTHDEGLTFHHSSWTASCGTVYLPNIGVVYVDSTEQLCRLRI